MKIIVMQSRGTAGPMIADGFAKALISMGHDIRMRAVLKANELKEVDAIFGYDWHGVPRNRAELPIAIVQYWADDPQYMVKDIEQTPLDLVYQSDYGVYKRLKSEGLNLKYLPLACDEETFTDDGYVNDALKCDVMFAGTPNPGRISLIEELSDMNAAVYGYGDGEYGWAQHEECFKKYRCLLEGPERMNSGFNSAKIILDHSSPQNLDSINLTVFSAMATKGLVITNHKNQVGAVLGKRAHVLPTYKTPEEARALVEHYLGDESARKELAALQREEVLKRHTYKRRAKKLVRHLREMLKTATPPRFQLSEDWQAEAAKKLKMEPMRIIEDQEGNERAIIVDVNWKANIWTGQIEPIPLTVNNPFCPVQERTRGIIDNQASREHEWGLNLNKKAEFISTYHNKWNLKKFPQHDVVYVASTGPSLNKNWEELKRLKTGKLIGVNAVSRLIPTQYLPYYCVVDARAPKEWWDGVTLTDTTCFADVKLNEDILQGHWRSIHWTSNSQETPFYDFVRKNYPKLLELEAGLSVTFSALMLALKFKPKTIVMVGQDCCFYDDSVHFHGDKTKEWGFEAFEELTDINGNKVKTNRIYLEIAKHITGLGYFLVKEGIRFINATEGGIVHSPPYCDGEKDLPTIEQRKLSEVVDELEEQHG